MPVYEIQNLTNNRVFLPDPIGGKIDPRGSRSVDCPAHHVQTSPMIRMVNAKILTIVSVANSGDVPDNLETLPTTSLDEGVRALYVDITNGVDANTGLTPNEPLKSVQRAVNLYKSGAIQHWPLNDNRYIHVMGAPGSEFKENIVVPPHAGMGALIIQGEEEVLAQDLEVSGSVFTSVPGFEVEQNLNLTGAGLAPSTLSYGAFVVPQVSFAETEFEAAYDMLPIKDNAAESLRTAAFDPGVFSGFAYFAGALVDVVSPNITWKSADSTAFSFTGVPTITNLGGALIIRGFRAAPADVGGNFSSFMNSAAGPGDSGNGSPVTLQRIAFTGGAFAQIVEGDALSMIGCSINDPASFPKLSSANTLVCQNILINSGICLVEGAGDISMYGASFDSSGAVNGGIRIADSTPVRYLAADIRCTGTGDGNLQLNSTSVNVQALSIEDAGALDAIQGLTGSDISITVAALNSRLNGSAGNSAHGCSIGVMSYVLSGFEANITLSGTAGDLKVGDLAAKAWTDPAVTDPDQLARHQT